ncbi:NepR family anti-sigma factor [Rhizobium sp. RU36D]|uniref:NepR family anti-sigma factor n=1 Tax=Rhizobium sp. RU36D TaxID=1907415 RepID=UPI0009D90AE6|nr:NepR family anti-sigma factor [Rhizobium sp. RU36D]SMD01536.1 hypothetical protein SAMN05880593_11554 [Rhizobium sp. RU36D]
MTNENSGEKKARKSSGSRRNNANTLIGTKLRTYYDAIVEEGTPDHLLDLLQRLDEAERELSKK